MPFTLSRHFTFQRQARAAWVLCGLGLLGGCGPDLLGAAATGAASKKTELEQGQASKAQAQEQLDRAMQQVKQRNEQAAQPNN